MFPTFMKLKPTEMLKTLNLCPEYKDTVYEMNSSANRRTKYQFITLVSHSHLHKSTRKIEKLAAKSQVVEWLNLP